MNNGEFEAYTQRVDELVERVSHLPESEARTAALELLQSLMDLHGAAMARIVELLSEPGDSSRKSLSKLASDPLVCGLLVLYGIHPATIEERVARAVEKLLPQLQKQGATAELIDISEKVVRLKIGKKTHASNHDKLRAIVEQAILEVAPEVAEIIVEGLNGASFVPVSMLQPAMKKEDKTYEESPA
jgi:Fe-S cluster biogenesis protein NfuA